MAMVILGLGSLFLVPTGAHAATLYGRDYVRIGVPDLDQAVTFFRDIMDCSLVSQSELTARSSTGDDPAYRLLSCDSDSFVELFAVQPDSPAIDLGGAQHPLQFMADSVERASEWLRRDGVTISGAPHRLKYGPLAGRWALNFRSPWGLELQLLGRESDRPTGKQLATLAAGIDGH